MQGFVTDKELRKTMDEMFKQGMMKRELHSRANDRYYLMIETDLDSQSSHQLLLMDKKATATDREFIQIGRNLYEEAMELAVTFATFSNLF